MTNPIRYDGAIAFDSVGRPIGERGNIGPGPHEPGTDLFPIVPLAPEQNPSGLLLKRKFLETG
jgi:hypothetical protein